MKNLSLLSVLCILALLLSPSVKLYADSPLQRVAGNDRYQTATQISQKGWPDKSAYVIIATGQNFADALCAAPLSQKYNCPILLNIKENLLSSTKKEIQRLEAKNAVIIGGTGAISENVEKELKATGLSCTRISGEDRFDTSAKIAEKLDFNGEVCVATGLNFPDAISISSIATQKGMPVLLTMTYKCPQSVKDYIKNKNITAAYIVGSDDVVSDGVAGNFPHVKRLQGNDIAMIPIWL
ncbi:cell wall-binding repeat-containing protein [Dehalobacter sp. TBBPA1]|uniref:cell wall-binding repeat-containing protein n=1 Tax=Dehalobacter sp. TBBPA1 TaxID=3235037 RepID=UPI0034A56A39